MLMEPLSQKRGDVARTLRDRKNLDVFCCHAIDDQIGGHGPKENILSRDIGALMAHPRRSRQCLTSIVEFCSPSVRRIGVVGSDANAIAPGKRPLSTMTPTILTEHGRVALVIGTPGGSRIAAWIFQVIADWHDFHMPLANAVAAPRFHHQLLPPNTLFEEPYAGLDPAVRAALTARGYTFVNQGWNGDIEAIAVGPSGTVAAADPRGRGVARVLVSPAR